MKTNGTTPASQTYTETRRGGDAENRRTPASPPPRVAMSRDRRVLAILAVILVVAAVLRALYLVESVRSPTFADPAVDALYHDYWARGLATGDWAPPLGYSDPLIRSTPFLRPPGYPHFLALVYRLSGPSYVAATVVQMVVGLVSCLIGFLFARRWFGDAVALVFTALMGTYWLFIYYEGQLLEPVLLVFLSLVLIYVLATWTERMTVWRGLLAGVLLGLGALVRPNILLFGGPALLWALWLARRRRSWRGLVPVLSGFVMGAVLSVAPATIRNYVVAHEHVLISANGGVNLWVGNNDRANGTYADAPIVEDTDCFTYPTVVRRVERILGRPLRYSEVSSFFAERAWDWIKANPWLELELLWYRTAVFWGPVEVHHNTVEAAERAHSPVLGRTVLNFPAVLSLFLVGIALFLVDARRRSRRTEAAAPCMERKVEVVAVILLFVATYFASFLPFFVVAQFRAPVIPFLLLMAAYAVVRLVLLVRSRAYRQVAGWAVACAFAGLLTSTNLSGHEVDFAKWHYDRGESFFKQEKIDDAIREYTEATRVSRRYPKAYEALGMALARNGDLRGAIDAYRKALQIKPDRPSTYVSLGLALEGMRKTDEAVAAYRTAIRYAPDYAEAYVVFGAAMQKGGRVDEAIAAYERAIRIAPDFGVAYRYLALGMYQAGRYPEAWKAVYQYRRYGGDLPEAFIRALSEKMAEPAN